MPRQEQPKPVSPNTDVVAKGVFAGMLATLLVHPFDVVKVRQQISPGRCSAFRQARQIFRSEGWRPFYCGLTAGLLRQATNTATRLAVYDMLFNEYAAQYKKNPVSMDKLVIGISAGLAGAMVGNPSEVVLIRRMSSGCHPCPACCHSYYYLMTGYRGTMDALRKILQQEGIIGLWRGATMTLLRSVVVSATQIGIYFNIREYLKEQEVAQDSFTLSLYSSIITTLIGAVLTHPIDRMKSIRQLSSRTAPPRRIFINILKSRGVFGLWRGFTPYFLRMATHTIVMFMVLEEIEKRKDQIK